VSDAAGELPAPRTARVTGAAALPAILSDVSIGTRRPVLVVVGGASGVSPEHLQIAAGILREYIIPALDRRGGAVVDGGTDSGIMRVMGLARSAAGASFPLVGVAAEGTVSLPGRTAAPDAVRLEPHHTHVILVPGGRWGDESPWLSRVATVIAAGQPSLTLVINGGQITYDDIRHSLQASRPVIVVAGTGRTADAIAAAARGERGDPQAAQVAAAPGLRIVPAGDPQALSSAVESALAARG
jgi:hypothetical protein